MSEYRSWGGEASNDAARAADLAAERRRERRRRWVRPHSITVLVTVGVVDAVALIVTSAIQNLQRNNAGRPCATFWADLAHDQTVGIWTVVVVLAVVTLFTVWRPWILVAALVVQLVAAALLIPPQVHDRAEYTAVAEGRKLPVEVDSGGAACDS